MNSDVSPKVVEKKDLCDQETNRIRNDYSPVILNL